MFCCAASSRLQTLEIVIPYYKFQEVISVPVIRVLPLHFKVLKRAKQKESPTLMFLEDLFDQERCLHVPLSYHKIIAN